MALQDFFVWGEGGSKKTPEQLDRERRLAQAMIASGVDASPVGHWTQGAARMANALAGNIKQARADKTEKAGIEGAAKKFGSLDLASLLSGGAAYPASVAAGGSPTSAAATGTPITSTPQAAEIKQGLEARGLPSHVADAFVMNFQDESGLNPGINEKNPIVPGSRGGYGLYQLTGPRRVAYEQFAQQRGVEPSNTDAQLDFLMTELQGPEARAAKSILSAPDTATAAQAIVNDFLRPAPEHRAARAAKYANAGGVQVASLDPSIGISQGGGATIRAGDYGPSSSAGNAPADGARATFGGPQLTYDDGGMRFVDEGAQRVAAAQPQTAAAAINQVAPRGMAAIPTPAAPQPQATEPSAELLRQNDIAFGGALAPQGSAPVQVADASGYFPAAPSADRAPIMGSYAAPVAPRQGGGNIAQLLEAASDPWMNDAQRSVIGMALQQQIQQNDPMRALQAQKLQLEMDALRAKPQTEYGFTTLPDGTVLRTDKRSGNAEPIYSAGQKPTSDMQEYNFAVSQGFKGSFADYQQAMKKAGASSTNVSVGEGDKFYEALDKKNADTFAALSDTGMQARSKLAQVERLGGLMQASPTGATAALKLAAGEYGIKTDGLDDLQAAQALINELVPQQRQPGSGPMSDADLALFKQSLPRIINTPDGNQLILDTMRGITQYQIQMGDIADQVANREISAAEGRNRIKNLKNPLEGFRTSTKDKTTGKSGVSGNRLRFNPQTGDFE